jgi:oligopeptide transport system substrate-binding protein
MKRFKVRNSFALMLLAVLIVPLLAACGGAAQTTAPTAAPAAPAATAAPAAPAATAAPAAPAATAAPEPTAAAPEAAEPTAAAPEAAGDNTLRISFAVWPDDLHPQRSSFANEIAILSLNYEGLAGLDKDLQTVPAAAESWEYNADATSITFKLRDGLTYSDGSPLTAERFVQAARRWLDPRDAGDYQATLEMIKGADAILGTAIPTDEGTLDQKFQELAITAPDDKTITVEFTKPTPYFHTLATMWGFFPVQQELIDAGGETWWQDAANHVGNGPFQVTSIDQGNNLIEYVANENYWDGRPKLDGVQLRIIEDPAVALQAYQSGEIDMFEPDPNDIPTIKADAALSPEYKEYAGSCTLTLQFNLTKAPFDNPKVREAFAVGFDREGYTRDALKGTEIPTLTWIPTGYPGYDASEDRFAYDPEKAKALLAEAGFPNGEGLPEIKVTYSSSNPANQARAEYTVQIFQTSLGVTLIPDPVEATTLTNLQKSPETFPQMINGGGWCADYPDPQNWLSIYWHTNSNFAQRIGYSNADADALMDQADVETDPAKRADLYAQAQDMIVGDVGRVMRSNNLNTYMVKPYVKGLDFTPQDSTFPGQETGLFNVTIER